MQKIYRYVWTIPKDIFADDLNNQKYYCRLRKRHEKYLGSVSNVRVEKLLRIFQLVMSGHSLNSAKEKERLFLCKFPHLLLFMQTNEFDISMALHLSIKAIFKEHCIVVYWGTRLGK